MSMSCASRLLANRNSFPHGNRKRSEDLSNQSTHVRALGAVIGVAIGVSLVCIVLVCFWHCMTRKKPHDREEAPQPQPSPVSPPQGKSIELEQFDLQDDSKTRGSIDNQQAVTSFIDEEDINPVANQRVSNQL